MVNNLLLYLMNHLVFECNYSIFFLFVLELKIIKYIRDFLFFFDLLSYFIYFQLSLQSKYFFLMFSYSKACCSEYSKSVCFYLHLHVIIKLLTLNRSCINSKYNKRNRIVYILCIHHILIIDKKKSLNYDNILRQRHMDHVFIHNDCNK
jgi:hypothetical protein